ncbi:glycosyltransferase family 39 protein [Candidatus Calescamantes bacterium]|nr:glycosyltransferase family 39 protein [Candidatus Calescamantes bacterium]
MPYNHPEGKLPLIYLLILLSLAAFLRIYRLDQESLWYDELVSVHHITHHSFHELVSYIPKREGKPPGYYLFLYMWSKMGISPFMLRLFSSLCGIFSVWMIYLLGREWKDEKTGLLASFLLTISPYHVWYSQETRMYSFLMLMVVISSFYLLRLIKGGGRGYGYAYVFSASLMLYIHPLAFLIFLSQVIYFFANHPRLPSSKYHYFLFSPFILWLPYLFTLRGVSSSSLIGWLPSTNWATPFYILHSFSFGLYPKLPSFLEILGYWFFFLFFLKGCRGIYQKKKKDLVFFMFFLPLIIAILVSLKKPIIFNGRRYLIIILPFYYLILAYSWNGYDLKGSFLICIFIAIILSFSMIQLYTQLQKRPWKESVEFVKRNMKEGDAYLVVEFNGELLRYYGLKAPCITLPGKVTNEMVEKRLYPFSRIWILSVSPRLSPLEKFLKETGKLKPVKVYRNSLHQLIRVSVYWK